MVFANATKGTLASYSTPIAATIPDGVTAYYAESNTPNNGTLKLTQITDGIIPAGQGVIIEQSAESPTATYYQPTTATTTSSITSQFTATSKSWSSTVADNLTKVSSTTTQPLLYTTDITSSSTGYISVANSTNIYGLGEVSGTQGFYHFSETGNISMPPYKAYLNTTSNAGAIKLEFPDGSTTSIHGVNVAPRTDNAATYDLSGRRVTKTVKGNLYIQNGKKFLAE